MSERNEKYAAWTSFADYFGWADQRRTGHPQKWYLGRVAPKEFKGQGTPVDLYLLDSIVFYNLLSDQQRDDVLGEMNMRYELVVLIHSESKLEALRYQALSRFLGRTKPPKEPGGVGLVNTISDPAKVADAWVLLNSLQTEVALREYLDASRE